MRPVRTLLIATSAMLLAATAYAQDTGIAPLPATGQDRITPDDNADNAILTTHKNNAAGASDALPWKNATDATPAPSGTAPSAPLSTYQPKMPFGHAEAPAPTIPEGPHATVAVPVVNVQSLEAPEAAPPTPVAPQADPAQENPENPTELTSPIFGDSATSTLPRKIILRLLNKVTAQATLLTLKPNETVKVGQLEITAITCQVSAPQSQTDYAGLLDIVERSQTNNTVKPLFRGWMYASSPSITALEHPVYDVTMVECEIPQPAKKDEEKPVKKGRR